MSLNLSDALEHDGQTPDIIKVATQENDVDTPSEDLQGTDIYDSSINHNVGDEVVKFEGKFVGLIRKE